MPKVDMNNDIYLYGHTNGSTTGIATAGASQTTLGSNPDTYLVKFRDCQSAATASSNTPICIGGTLNLTASGGTNYDWTGPNGFTSNLQNPTILNTTAANSGEYFCNITGTSGCDGIMGTTVLIGDIIKPIPNIAVLPTITGDCTTRITAPSATDNCATNVIGTTTDPITFNLPGTYDINWNYTDGSGNTETQVQIVNILDVAFPTLNSPQHFCIQQNTTLGSIAISGQNIKWYDAAIGGNLLPANTIVTDAITYYASQTINGCESLTTEVLIGVQSTNAPTGNGTQTLCATQIPTLQDLDVTGNDLIWYQDASGSIILTLSHILVDGVTYYASQNNNGCESILRLPVTVNLITTLSATDYDELVCDDLNDGIQAINLADYETKLIANPTPCTFRYYNSLQDAEHSDVALPLSLNYNLISGLNNIYVRITSDNGCSQIVTLALTLVLVPVVPITDIVPLCEGREVVVDAGLGFESYEWSTGATSQIVTITQPNDYSVKVMQMHGQIECTTVKNFTVVLSGIATITSIGTRDWTATENEITVNTTGDGIFTYSIDGINFQSSNVFSELNSGAYTVYVKDKNGCGIVMEEVYLLMYPKYFTPNGDGFNDTWSVQFSETEPGLNVNIFDRYGKLVKTLDNNDSWSGTFNGHALPGDDYWFVVTRASGKNYKGHFSLKR